MRQGLIKTIDWTSRAFSDNGTPSSSRVLTLLHSLVSMFVLVYIAVKNHGAIDISTCSGLGAFATVHYFVNSGRAAVESFNKKKDGD